MRRHLNSFRKTVKLIEERKYSFIHTHTPVASAIVRQAAHKTGTKVIYTAHGFHFYDGAPLKNWLIYYYPIEKYYSRYTDILITINKEDFIRASENFYAKKTVYIPGVGVDTEKFAPRQSSREKIRADEYDVCIVVGWELMKTVNSQIGGDFLGRAAYYEKEGKGIEFPFPKLFGRLADETLKKYPDLDENRYMDALARISVNNYSNAKRNPLAQTRKWFMSFEQASTRDTETNPLVGGRLGVSDCSQVTDGAAVVVLASERYVKERGKTGKPVIKGYGHRTAPMLFEKKMTDNEGSRYTLPWTRQAVLDAYKRSGLTVDDIDVFETHDCFTSSEYAAISAFGITEPGKEYEAVENRTISFTGSKPINPSGGLIGCGHPVGASGARMLLDLYKQVTGTADGYQVEGVKNGIMLNIGGSATTNYVFIVGKE